MGFFVTLPICLEHGMCFCYSTMSVYLCVKLVWVYVCIHNALLLALSSIFEYDLHGWAWVDTAFSLAFIPLSSRRSFLHILGQLGGSTVLIAWEQQKEWGAVTERYSVLEGICELAWLAHNDGWVVWVRPGCQNESQTNIKLKRITADFCISSVLLL